MNALINLYRSLVSSAPAPALDDALANLAATHRLTPFAYAELRRRRITLPPLWREYFVAQLARSTMLAARAEEMRYVLRDLAVIAWKGLDVAQRFYTDPSERPMNDHDLLVREVDFAEALQRLQAAGFAENPASRQGVASAPEHYAAQLVRDGYSVDLHRAVRQSVRAKIDYEKIFARAEPGPFGFLQLSEPDALLLSCYHVAAHELLVPLIAYVDIERWLERTEPPIEEAMSWGIWRPLAAVLWMCGRLRGETTPAPFWAARLLPSPEEIMKNDHDPVRTRQLVRKFFLIDHAGERARFAMFALRVNGRP